MCIHMFISMKTWYIAYFRYIWYYKACRRFVGFCLNTDFILIKQKQVISVRYILEIREAWRKPPICTTSCFPVMFITYQPPHLSINHMEILSVANSFTKKSMNIFIQYSLICHRYSWSEPVMKYEASRIVFLTRSIRWTILWSCQTFSLVSYGYWLSWVNMPPNTNMVIA